MQWGAVPLGVLALPAAQLRVYACIAAHAGRDGVAWCSQPTIREHTKLTERPVQTAIRALEAAGWLVSTPGSGRRTTFYRVIRQPPRGAVESPSPGLPGAPVTEQGTDQDKKATLRVAEEDFPVTSRTADPDQYGLDLGMPEPETPAKPAPRTTPTQEIVAVYAQAYSDHHHRAPLRCGQVGRHAKLLLSRGVDRDLVETAARRLGTTDHGNLESMADEVQREAPASWPSGWGQAPAPVVDRPRVSRIEGW